MNDAMWQLPGSCLSGTNTDATDRYSRYAGVFRHSRVGFVRCRRLFRCLTLLSRLAPCQPDVADGAGVGVTGVDGAGVVAFGFRSAGTGNALPLTNSSQVRFQAVQPLPSAS